MKLKNKKTKEIIAKPDPDAELISFITTCHKNGDDYRRKFKTRWDKIEEQIRCVHPDDWDKKEDWQSRIFIPQQAKTVETSSAYLDKMLFGNKRFYGIQGVEQRDKEDEGHLMELYDNVFDRGNFYLENDFIVNESSGIGTGFLKVLVNPKRTGLQFIWRSPYNITIDPECGHRLDKARFIIDEYKKPITELIDEVRNDTSLYKRERVQALIDKAEEVGRSLTQEALTQIKDIDGTEIFIASEYRDVNIIEFWGKCKKLKKEETDTNDKKETKTKYTYEDRIVVLANERAVLRDDENPYGFLPFFACRIKPRKYDFYGLGFCDTVVDLQELTNSMINLGFDSLKMCSMDIAMVDATKIKDPASIDYRPMAVWLFKGNPREAAVLTRQGISALSEIIKGLGVLDQFMQEATGVLRQIQGAPDVSGAGSETLGEYQAKLAMIDNRFLKIARFIERDYIEPLLKGVFKILFNPKFFNQALIDRILGFKEVEIQAGVDPITQQPIKIKQKVSKLDFNKIASIGEMGFDFKAVGMTNFTKSIETLQKLKELLVEVVKTPQLMIISKVEEIYKRVLQAAEIQDYEDLIKSDEEIEKIMNQIYSGQQTAMPMGAGAPAMQGV